MKVAVFGKSGQVATELARRAGDMQLMTLDRAAADFTRPAEVASVAAALPEDVGTVINAVAYTAVDKAEDDADAATLVNATTVGALARVCAERQLPLIHISTDYVFPGSGTVPWQPSDATGPLGVYGATKLSGEEAIRTAGGPHAILRTSWVFSAHGANFVKTMLRLAESRDSLTVVGDQIGGPTPAAAIADTCLTLSRRLSDGGPSGTYHFAGTPDVSWADFAREIFRQAGRDVTVADIATADYPTAATRPLNSRLDCATLSEDHGIARPDWHAGLSDVLKELT